MFMITFYTCFLDCYVVFILKYKFAIKYLRYVYTIQICINILFLYFSILIMIISVFKYNFDGFRSKRKKPLLNNKFAVSEFSFN